MTFLVDLIKKILEIFKAVIAFIDADLDSIKEAVSNLG